MESKVVDKTKKIGSITVFEDLSEKVPPIFTTEIFNLRKEGVLFVVADISRVEFVSSSGIGALAVAAKDLQNRCGSLIIVCDNKKLLGQFNITMLDRIVTIFKTVDEGIQSV